MLLPRFARVGGVTGPPPLLPTGGVVVDEYCCWGVAMSSERGRGFSRAPVVCAVLANPGVAVPRRGVSSAQAVCAVLAHPGVAALGRGKMRGGASGLRTEQAGRHTELAASPEHVWRVVDEGGRRLR
eukprot:scaffold132816_cov23-Tisochrysis_lutea.AAC.2